jgi:hypothetical protein
MQFMQLQTNLQRCWSSNTSHPEKSSTIRKKAASVSLVLLHNSTSATSGTTE